MSNYLRLATIAPVLALSACASGTTQKHAEWYPKNCQERYECGSVAEEKLTELHAKPCHELAAQRQRNLERIFELKKFTRKEDARAEKLAEIAFTGMFYFAPPLIITMPALAINSLLDGPQGQEAAELERQNAALSRVSDAKKCVRYQVR